METNSIRSFGVPRSLQSDGIDSSRKPIGKRLVLGAGCTKSALAMDGPTKFFLDVQAEGQAGRESIAESGSIASEPDGLRWVRKN